MRRADAGLALAGCATLAACGGGPSERGATGPTQPSPSAAACEYDVAVVEPVAVVDVAVRCRGVRVSGFVADAALVPFTSRVLDANGRPPPRVGARFAITPGEDAELHYRVDLDAASRAADDFDVALGIGRSLVAPASSYLMAPDPALARVAVTVRVHPGPGASFTTALAPQGDAFALGAHELHRATYGVFGAFDADVLSLPGAGAVAASQLHVVSLDGHFAVARDRRLAWVKRAATAVAGYYGGFPVERAMVALVPIDGRPGVLFGKVLPAGGSAVVVLIGSRATERELDGDWILVHELFHLGFPSFVGEGTWLDEGLATYVEPFLRARAGLLTEEQAWTELVRGLPRGIPLCESTGLEHSGVDRQGIYWGGAIVALLADVEALRRTGGARGLDDGVRALLARGGDATHVWSLREAIDSIDAGIGTRVLAPLAEAYAYRASPLPLDAVLAELGVEPAGGTAVHLSDEAPLFAIRRRITWGRGGEPEKTTSTPAVMR